MNDEIEICREKKDFLAISKNAHLLKGSAAALGIKKLRLSCEKIQYTGERKFVSDEGLMTEMITKLLKDALQQYEEALDVFSTCYGLMPMVVE